MDVLKYDIILTEDGSHSVQIRNTEISFHSTKGAIQESAHIFIDAGLRYFKNINPRTKNLKIFEVGFGTGLNALLTAIEAPKLKVNITYQSIDKFPLTDDIFFKLNYADLLGEKELYKIITLTPWNQLVYISPFFKLNKIKAGIEEYTLNEKFDLIYFDAFAPNDQPELWTEEIFSKMYGALNAGGVLVTYSTKSIIQKAMHATGFNIEKLPGPPGKREILRAKKI